MSSYTRSPKMHVAACSRCTWSSSRFDLFKLWADYAKHLLACPGLRRQRRQELSTKRRVSR